MKWVWRILGGIVVLILLLVVCLWIAGLRENHGVNSASVTIDRPAAQVWRFLTDDEKVKKWTGLSEITPLGGDPHKPGWRARMVEASGKERLVMEWELTAIEENRHIGFILRTPDNVQPGFVEQGDYTLVEQNGKTTVTLSGRSEYKGWVRLMEPVITPMAQKKLNQDLLRIKGMIEAEPLAAPPPAAQ